MHCLGYFAHQHSHLNLKCNNLQNKINTLDSLPTQRVSLACYWQAMHGHVCSHASSPWQRRLIRGAQHYYYPCRMARDRSPCYHHWITLNVKCEPKAGPWLLAREIWIHSHAVHSMRHKMSIWWNRLWNAPPANVMETQSYVRCEIFATSVNRRLNRWNAPKSRINTSTKSELAEQ